MIFSLSIVKIFDYIYVCTFLVSYMIIMKHHEALTKFAKRPACPLYHFQANLKWIHSLAAGVDTLVPVLKTLPGGSEVPLTNAKGAFSRSLAEYSIAAMMHFNKQIPRLQVPGLWTKEGICGDFGFVLGRGYHKPVFWWKLMTFWDIFCWELCWLAFCQSWRHNLNPRLHLYILYVFFWRHLKKIGWQNRLFYSQNKGRQTPQHQVVKMYGKHSTGTTTRDMTAQGQSAWSNLG